MIKNINKLLSSIPVTQIGNISWDLTEDNPTKGEKEMGHAGRVSFLEDIPTEGILKKIDSLLIDYTYHCLRDETEYIMNYVDLIKMQINLLRHNNPSMKELEEWIGENIKSRYERKRFITCLFFGPLSV